MKDISLNDFIENLPDYWIIKDVNSYYINANDNFLALINLRRDELKGLTDFNMPWANTHAVQYISDDKFVLGGNKKINYRETQYRAKIIEVNVNKTPIYSGNEIVGLTCSFTECIQNTPIKLSQQQRICLKHVVSGLTAKETARLLQLSVRTVEFYTELLKDKFKCKNKAELIHKGIKFFKLDLQY